MAPIRLGIIGLSANPSAWAYVAHIPYLRSNPEKYTIAALCNSSLTSTNAAIKAHNLPASTRAYDSPAALAADPEVDLVVISTRVDTHYELALPVLRARKNIFIEWPLAANPQQAREMIDLAKENGVKTIIGFQGRKTPWIGKIKDVIASGGLGTVHSVNIHTQAGVWQNGAMNEKYSYMADSAVGGNLLTIYAMHMLDAIFFVHGEPQPTYSTLLGNLRPEMRIAKPDGSITTETYPKSTPDQILMHGHLSSSSDKAPAPVFTYHLRAGNRFTGTPGATWRIYGDKAELLVEIDGAAPQVGAGFRVRICDGATGKVEELSIEEDGDEWAKLSPAARQVGRLYEAYANGDEYPDWDVAGKRFDILEKFYDGGM